MRCNYCDWQRLKAKGYKIATAQERMKLNSCLSGGVVVVDEKGEFVAWFMSLPNHCCC